MRKYILKGSGHTDKHHILRSWLKSARVEKGLSLRQAGILFNVHHSIIGKIETGKRRIDVVEFLEYCHSIKVDPFFGLNFIINNSGE